ncbi:MAG: 30S ribosomal protein S27ae [Thermoplasmata archaeon]
MAKARIGLYSTKGDTLTRTHKSCPKCGPGTFLAEHPNRRSCGRCGYSETRAASDPRPVVAAKPEKAKGAKPAKPAPAPKPAAAAPAAAARPAKR